MAATREVEFRFRSLEQQGCLSQNVYGEMMHLEGRSSLPGNTPSWGLCALPRQASIAQRPSPKGGRHLKGGSSLPGNTPSWGLCALPRQTSMLTRARRRCGCEGKEWGGCMARGEGKRKREGRKESAPARGHRSSPPIHLPRGAMFPPPEYTFHC